MSLAPTTTNESLSLIPPPSFLLGGVTTKVVIRHRVMTSAAGLTFLFLATVCCYGMEIGGGPSSSGSYSQSQSSSTKARRRFVSTSTSGTEPNSADVAHAYHRPQQLEAVFLGSVKFYELRRPGNFSVTLRRRTGFAIDRYFQREAEGMTSKSKTPTRSAAAFDGATQSNEKTTADRNATNSIPSYKGLWIPKGMNLVFAVVDGVVEAVTVTSTEDGFEHLPPFHLVISPYPDLEDAEGNLVAPPNSLLNVTSAHPISIPSVDFPVKVICSSTQDVEYHIRLAVFARRWLSYESTIQVGSLLESEGELHPVVPPNSTVGTTFLVLPRWIEAAPLPVVGQRRLSIGVWVKRKPPIPDFFLEVFAARALAADRGETSNPNTPKRNMKNGGEDDDEDGDDGDGETNGLSWKRLLIHSFDDVHPRGMGVDDALAALRCELPFIDPTTAVPHPEGDRAGQALAEEGRLVYPYSEAQLPTPPRGTRTAADRRESKASPDAGELPHPDAETHLGAALHPSIAEAHHARAHAAQSGERIEDKEEKEVYYHNVNTDIKVGDAMCSWIAHTSTFLKFKVTFEEIPRAYHATFHIPNYENVLAKLRRYDLAVEELKPIRATFPVEYPPGRAAKLGIVFKKELSLQLQYIERLQSVSLMVVQSTPIQRLQVHAIDGLGQTVFHEEESFVPFIVVPKQQVVSQEAAQKVPQHFGWHFALPANSTVPGNSLTVRVFYDAKDAHPSSNAGAAAGLSQKTTLLDQLNHWLAEHGGTIADWYWRRNRVGRQRLVPRAGAKKGEILLRIPFSVLITDHVASSVPFIRDLTREVDWIKMRANLRKEYERLTKQMLRKPGTLENTPTSKKDGIDSNDDDDDDDGDDGVKAGRARSQGEIDRETIEAYLEGHTPWDEAQDQLSRIALFLLTQPESQLGDTVKFHLVTQNLKDLVARAKVDYHDDELLTNLTVVDEVAALVSPYLKSEAAKHRSTYQAEYSTAVAKHPWILSHVSYEEYEVVRAHLFAKSRNSTDGVLFLIPLLDQVVHNDDPSAELHFDADQEMVHVVAARNLQPHETEITLDFGSGEMSKMAFFLRFGFVPFKGQDCVDVGGVELLVREKRSRTLVLDRLAALHSQDDSTKGGQVHQRKEQRKPQSAKKSNMILRKAMLSEFQRLLTERVQSLGESYSKLSSASLDPDVQHAAERLLQGMRNTLSRHLDWVKDDLLQLAAASDEL